MDTPISSSSNSSTPECNQRIPFIFLPLFMAYILLIPLFISVLYVGFQQWRKQRLGSTAATTSHSDIFTFHMVALELFSIIGSGFYCYGILNDHLLLIWVGMSIFSIISPGQTLFHLITCVVRYLAVVHPVTYLRLRQAGRVRIRNIIIGCVWLLCFLAAVPSNMAFLKVSLQITLLACSSVVVSVCSLCALCVLIRPRPGEVGANRGRVDQSKQRAVYNIMVIMGALLFKFLSTLLSTAIIMSPLLSDCEDLILLWSTGWFSMPGSLVLPLLFLHRAGKLPGCTHNTASVGQMDSSRIHTV